MDADDVVIGLGEVHDESAPFPAESYPVTAPTPERRVGEAWLTFKPTDAHAAEGYPHEFGGGWFFEAKAQRAAVDLLTAEVERLTKERAEAVAIAEDYQVQAELFAGDGVHLDPTLAALRARLAALSLPTPATEATEEERNFAARQPFLGCRKDAIAPEGVTDAS